MNRIIVQHRNSGAEGRKITLKNKMLRQQDIHFSEHMAEGLPTFHIQYADRQIVISLPKNVYSFGFCENGCFYLCLVKKNFDPDNLIIMGHVH